MLLARLARQTTGGALGASPASEAPPASHAPRAEHSSAISSSDARVDAQVEQLRALLAIIVLGVAFRFALALLVAPQDSYSMSAALRGAM